MTIGVGTFIPNGHFALPRSYIYKIAFAGILDMPTIAANRFEFHPAAAPTDTYIIYLDGRFFNWNSNRWTLDYMIAEAYYISFPSPTHIPVNYTLKYEPSFPDQPPSIRFYPFGYADTPNFFPLPSQDTDYWLPPPL